MEGLDVFFPLAMGHTIRPDGDRGDSSSKEVENTGQLQADTFFDFPFVGYAPTAIGHGP